MAENTPRNLLYNNSYRIPSARMVNHAYDGGAYFVTICTKDRKCYFGDIDGEMHLSPIGEYAEKMIQEICRHNAYAYVPCWVVMPNHIHLVVVIDIEKIPYERRGDEHANLFRRDVACRISTTGAMNDNLECRDVACRVSTLDGKSEYMQSVANMQGWLSVVVGGFKSSVTKFAHENDMTFGWQTRFHDRIIRNHDEMNKIADYIETNVAKWNNDCFYT